MMEYKIGTPWGGTTWLLVPVPSKMSPRTMSTSTMPLPTLLKPLHQPTSLQMIPSWPITVPKRDLNCLNKKESLHKKLQQFHDHRVFDQKKPRGLTYEQRSKSLAYLMLLKINNNKVMIKRTGCVDWKNQRNWLSKDDTSFQYVSSEGLMLSWMIDAGEGWDIATYVITGTFIKNDYGKEDIHIKTEGKWWLY